MKTTRSQHAVSKDVLREKARLIRLETLRMTDICGSGHYGSSFSMAEIVATLYYRFMQVRPGEPQWPDRDRFTMGKGHAAIGLFPVLSDLGFFPQSWLDTYTLGTRRRGSPARTVCLMGDGEQTEGRPTCLLAYTVSGKGVSFMEGGWEWHLGFLGPKDLQRAYKEVLEGSLG